MPMRIRISRLEPSKMPASSGTLFSEMWSKETSTLGDLEKVVMRWRYNRRGDGAAPS
jgi:hypothetical protein